MRGRALLAGAGLVALMGVHGCSSDPQADYCHTVEDHQDDFSEAVAQGGPTALLTVLPDMVDLRDQAPDDIQGQWQQVTGRLLALRKALDDAGVDPTSYDRDKPPSDLSAADKTAIDAAAKQLVSADTVTAFEQIQTQVRDVCHTPLYR
ncbi:hypothetical protein [Nocardioides acrostichi]|uniref:Uncharacterized protein n=1 Tax=Nocardioides acrostichi TaxID=2784339 RepID=A0A930V3I2_9ACTN|nr:hypothetical protein [Nocardioides acrostichi]MBF4163186.1 hypothetical protein [Nocardioides acrostichi]